MFLVLPDIGNRLFIFPGDWLPNSGKPQLIYNIHIESDCHPPSASWVHSLLGSIKVFHWTAMLVAICYTHWYQGIPVCKRTTPGRVLTIRSGNLRGKNNSRIKFSH